MVGREKLVAVRPMPLRTPVLAANLLPPMNHLHRRHHHAEPVQLAEGWIGICATCGWVSRDYGSEQHASAESASHTANAGECLGHSFRRTVGRRVAADRRTRRGGCAA